jgi:hypothetical protein
MRFLEQSEAKRPRVISPRACRSRLHDSNRENAQRAPLEREDMNMACNASCELHLSRATRNRRTGLGACLALCAALALALGASALSPSAVAAQATEQPGGLKDASPHDRPMMLTLWSGINWGYYAHYGFPLNIGARFYIPIVKDGFIPQVNDEFGIEFGADFNFVFVANKYDYGSNPIVGFAMPVEAMYDFHFTRSFDAYVKAGFMFGSDFSNYLHDGFYVNFVSCAGIRLELTPGLYFRAEAGYPWLKAGIAFAF